MVPRTTSSRTQPDPRGTPTHRAEDRRPGSGPHESPGLVYEAPKAVRSRRTLALPAQLVDALRAHRAAQLEELMTAGPLSDDHNLAFARVNGGPLEGKSDWRRRKALLREAGVRGVRLHDGRHTAATLLLSEGVHPRVVMELLGHSQMRTTTDTYSHVLPALAKEAADRMGAALWANEVPAHGAAR
jgi:integrase